MTPTLRLAIMCSYAIPTTIHGGPKPLDLPATTGESPTSLPSPRPSQQRCPCRRAGSSSAQPPLPAAPGPNASCPLRPEARTTAPGHTPPAAPPLARAQPMHVRGSGSPTPPALSSLRSAPHVTFAGPDLRAAPGPRASARGSPPPGGRRRRRRGPELGTARRRPGLRGTSPLPEAGAQQALPARRPHASRPPPRRAQGPPVPQRPLLSPSAPSPSPARRSHDPAAGPDPATCRRRSAGVPRRSGAGRPGSGPDPP